MEGVGVRCTNAAKRCPGQVEFSVFFYGFSEPPDRDSGAFVSVLGCMFCMFGTGSRSEMESGSPYNNSAREDFRVKYLLGSHRGRKVIFCSYSAVKLPKGCDKYYGKNMNCLKCLKFPLACDWCSPLQEQLFAFNSVCEVNRIKQLKPNGQSKKVWHNWLLTTANKQVNEGKKLLCIDMPLKGMKVHKEFKAYAKAKTITHNSGVDMRLWSVCVWRLYPQASWSTGEL